MMNRMGAMKLLVMLAMLLSIAGGPAVASAGGEMGKARVVCKCGCCGAGCCAVGEKGTAREMPAPVGQQVGAEVAAAVLTTRFEILYVVAPTVAREVDVKAVWHGPAPLAVSCARLI